MNNAEQAREHWIRDRPKYEAFGCLIGARVEALLRPLGIWFDVSARAKDIDSLVKKLLRKDHHTYQSLPDKVGIRVVVRYRSDIGAVLETLNNSFDCEEPDDKVRGLGTDRVGYQSVHLDKIRLHDDDPDAIKYPPDAFWAELQVRTLAQHLWSEMSHDSVYKNDEMVSALSDDLKRRVNLMAGQIEVADREFDRLNSELGAQPAVHLLHMLEKHYYRLTSRRPDPELSLQALTTLMPLVKEDLISFSDRLDEFLSAKRPVLEAVYSKATESGPEDTTSFLFQPEVLMIYDLLLTEPIETRRLWNKHYPEPELERIANAFGISLD